MSSSSERTRARTISARARSTPWRKLGHDLVQQRPCAARVAGLEVVARGLDRAGPGRLSVVRGRQRTSLLEQLRRRDRRPSSGGEPGRLVQSRGDLGVRSCGAECQVARALFGSTDERGKPDMELANARSGTCVRGGCEQRMREANPAGGDADDLLLDRAGERAARVQSGGAADELEGRVGERGRLLRAHASSRRAARRRGRRPALAGSVAVPRPLLPSRGRARGRSRDSLSPCRERTAEPGAAA